MCAFYLPGPVETTTVLTHLCPLEEGMGKPQYLSEPDINGEHTSIWPDINPGGAGVTFTSATAIIAIDLASSITPIIEYVSIANKTITNVNQLFVTVIASDGSIIQTIDSPVDNTVVTGFPDSPLPLNSTLLIMFETSDHKPPHHVTLSIIACFHPELATTVPSITSGYSTTLSKSFHHADFENIIQDIFGITKFVLHFTVVETEKHIIY